MHAIPCSAKKFYPPKDFKYHLLTKNYHQYLKERVFNNFAVRLRKSGSPCCNTHEYPEELEKLIC